MQNEIDHKFNTELFDEILRLKLIGYSFAQCDKKLKLVAGRSRQCWLNGKQNGYAMGRDIFNVVREKVDLKKALMV
jgi:hypothetical protein